MSRRKAEGWRPPTRRAFVSMLGAAAAALALPARPSARAAPVSEPTAPEPMARPIWIGHA